MFFVVGWVTDEGREEENRNVVNGNAPQYNMKSEVVQIDYLEGYSYLYKVLGAMSYVIGDWCIPTTRELYVGNIVSLT